MSIRFESRPSTDGLGVKRWTYELNAMWTLHVYDRPRAYADGARFMIRAEHKGGKRGWTWYRAKKEGARRKANWCLYNVARIESGDIGL